jgi:putative membrane protein
MVKRVLKLVFIFVLAFIFLIGGYLTASKQIYSSEIVTVTLLLTISIPALGGVAMNVGIKKASLGLILLAILAYTIESIGILTGFPYGSFMYKGSLGPQLFDIVPLLLPFVWIPFVLTSFAITKQLKLQNITFIIAGTLILLGLDLIIDPAAVALNYWSYDSGGIYFGVPLSNFAGWILSGSIAMIISRLFFLNTDKEVPQYTNLTTIVHLLFFCGVVFYFQFWIPLAIGTVYILVLSFLYIFKEN